ncbi:MAG: hypothetical protein QXG00_07005 [Candidatus Woesearchaeota archaeon]
MSILKYLKEDIFKDYDSVIPEESIESSNIESETPEEITPPKENETFIDKRFVVRLVDYVDSKINLPAFGSFDDAILNEIRKVMDESDNKLVLRTKQRIHKIILDEKKKFLEKIQRRVGNLKVPKVPKKVQ